MKQRPPWGKIVFVGLLAAGTVALVTRPKKKSRRSRLIIVVKSEFRRATLLLGIKKRPPLVYTSSVENAASDGVRILVNLSWVEQILDRHCSHIGCSSTVLLGVLAHELTHHLRGDAFCNDALHGRELRADRVSGRVLAAANVLSDAFERVIEDISSCCSLTHPPGYVRRLHIRRGYEEQRAKM